MGRATTAGRAGTCPAAAQPMARGHQSRPASARSLVVVGDLGADLAQAAAQGVVDADPVPAQVVGDPAGLGVDRGDRGGPGHRRLRRRRPSAVDRRRRTARGGGRARPAVSSAPDRRRRRPRPPLGLRSASQPSSGPMRAATRRRPPAAPRASRSEARVRRSRTSATEQAISCRDGVDGLDLQVAQPGHQRVEQLGPAVGQGQHGRGLGAVAAGQVGGDRGRRRSVPPAAASAPTGRGAAWPPGRAPAQPEVLGHAAAAGRRPRAWTTASTVSSAILR